MLCHKCGATIPDDSLFCENCGAQLEPIEEIDEIEKSAGFDEDEAVEDTTSADKNEAVQESGDSEETTELEEREDADDAEIFDEVEGAEEAEDAEDAEIFDEVDEDDEVEQAVDAAEDEDPGFSFEDLKLGETGQPEDSKEEWFKSFEELAPKDDDWTAEKGDLEVAGADEREVAGEDNLEAAEKREHKPTVEDLIDEELPEASVFKGENKKKPTVEDLIDQELPDESDLTENQELSDESEENLVQTATAKISSFLTNLGKNVHTGTGWATDAVKDKLAEMKAEKPESEVPEAATEEPDEPAEQESSETPEAATEEPEPEAATEEPVPEAATEEKPQHTHHREGRGSKHIERDKWSEEDMGELNLSSDFWYSSKKEKPEGAGNYGRGENSDGEVDDMTTKVVPVKRVGPGIPGYSGTRKKSGRALKIVVLIAAIAVLLGAGGIYGSKVHKEKEVEDTYQTTFAQANKYAEAKDYKNAETVYKKLIQEYPDRAELYENLAVMYIAQERFEDAKKVISEGVAKTGESETFTAMEEDIKALTSTEWREPFRRVLANNEWAVRRYDDINEVSVSLCDVTGDRKPELFFFTQEYYGYGKLHIYTYAEGKAQEITYGNKNRSTEQNDAFYDVERDECSYVIYKGKKDGEFGIYESFLHMGVDAWQTINEFTLSGTDCKKVQVTEACIKTDYRLSEEDDEDNNEYYKDEEEIGYKTYLKEFQEVLNDIDQVIITSKESTGDKEIWSRIIDMEDKSMDYDEAMKILDEDAN